MHKETEPGLFRDFPRSRAWPLVAILTLCATLAAGTAAAADAPGKLMGGQAYSLPAWFKPSFLEFHRDVEEARKRGRHVMAFIHLEGCPYCARMLEESFAAGPNSEFMQKHFDVIGINIRGSLDVAWIDGKTYTERTLSRHLGVIATPTIVFLDTKSNKVLQLNGYRDPRALRHALEFVQSGRYANQSFSDYVAARADAPVYRLRDHPQFSPVTDFSRIRKPLAVLFEDDRCGECARFHEKTLNHPEVAAEMGKLTFVRLDARSGARIVDLAGNATTPAQWAKALGLTYRPGMVIFDEGREVFRMDGRLYHFHFKEALRYASGGHYKRYGSISQYNAARREELLKQGKNIDYSE